MERTFDYDTLKAALDTARSGDELGAAIVNAPFDFPVAAALLFLGIIVYLRVDKSARTINRIALSDTELAQNTTEVSAVPFEEIKIPLNHSENVIAQSIKTGKPQETTDWQHLFAPALTAEQARINQASAGVAYSAVYPLEAPNGGALIFSYFQYQADIGKDQQDFMHRYVKLVNNALIKS